MVGSLVVIVAEMMVLCFVCQWVAAKKGFPIVVQLDARTNPLMDMYSVAMTVLIIDIWKVKTKVVNLDPKMGSLTLVTLVLEMVEMKAVH